MPRMHVNKTLVKKLFSSEKEKTDNEIIIICQLLVSTVGKNKTREGN